MKINQPTKCSTCGEIKDDTKIAKFGFDKNGKQEFVSVCKECRKHFSDQYIDFDFLP